MRSLFVLLLLAGTARATGTVETFAYVVPVGASALTTAVNGTYLAYDEPAPAAWRYLGFGAGIAAAAAGTVELANSSGDRDPIILGTIALAAGAAAIITAALAPSEPTWSVAPTATPTAALVTFTRRF